MCGSTTGTRARVPSLHRLRWGRDLRRGQPGGQYRGFGEREDVHLWQDVVRGVQAVTDPRLIAAMSEVPASYFQPPTDYFSPTVRSVHGVAEAANGATLYPATGGLSAKFVRGANYGNPAAPTVSVADLTYSAPSGADPLQPTAAPSTSVAAILPRSPLA